jgi:hypothetical protein
MALTNACGFEDRSDLMDSKKASKLTRKRIMLPPIITIVSTPCFSSHVLPNNAKAVIKEKIKTSGRTDWVVDLFIILFSAGFPKQFIKNGYQDEQR